MLYAELTYPEISRLAPERVVVLPIAAIEQHGAHLSVDTDTAIATELGRRVEAALPDKVLLLPTLWAGSSHHHLKFPGTLSISSDTYIRVLCDLIESLLAAGSRRIFLLNGHGGNQTPFSEALYRIALAHRDDRPRPWVAAQNYWSLAAPELAAQDFMESPRLTHACEYETSLMLALRAGSVKMNLAKGERAARDSEFYDPLEWRPSLVHVAETFEAMTPHGALGSPEKATVEKGHKLLDLITTVLVRFVNEFATWK
jgi:creatinine amidohydrolase